MERLAKKPKHEHVHHITNPDYATLWLDLLPAEVCRSIAALLLRAHTSHYALPLAESSPYQRHAVSGVVSNALCVNHQMISGRVSLTRWNDVLGADLKWADIGDITDHAGVFDILKRPDLSYARITDVESCLRAVMGKRSLRALRICKAPTNSVLDLQELLQTLYSLKLQEFAVDCSFPCHGCVLQRITKHLKTWELAVYCPGTTVLDIGCRSVHRKTRWAMIKAFPALKEVSLYDELIGLPRDIIEKLRSIDRVNVKRFYVGDLEVIREFATNVVTITCAMEIHNDMTAQDVESLRPFKNLRALCAHLEWGAEKAFAAIPRTVAKLQLTWEDDPRGFGHGSPRGYMPPYNTLVGFAEYPRLTCLHLCNAEVDSPILMILLKGLGSSLRDFGLYERCDYTLSLMEKMLAIMNWMTTYNPNINNFFFRTLNGSYPGSNNNLANHTAMQATGERLSATNEPGLARKVTLSKLLAALSVLRRRTKLVNGDELYTSIIQHFECCGVVSVLGDNGVLEDYPLSGHELPLWQMRSG